MHPMLNIAVRAARAAGNVINRGFENRSDLEVFTKDAQDFVTRVDREAEQAIIETIKKSYPEHSFLAEESGETVGQENDYQWIIDPLDGTTNFIQGVPHFCTSIALLVKGKLDQAVIYDPIRGDLFTGSKGQGAQLNGYRIRVANRKDLTNTLLVSAFPFKNKDEIDSYWAKAAAIYKAAGDIRRTGSAALDLAYVAAGKFDGYFERGIKAWDVAAGELIVREAGGVVTDYNGNNDPMLKGEIIAGNPKVLSQLVRHLKN